MISALSDEAGVRFRKEEVFMKRILALAAAICLVAIVASSLVFAQAGKNVVKPSFIKLMVDGTFQVKENGEQVIVDGFKALTGIDLVLNHPIHNEYYQKVDLAFSTGDIPDVLILSSNYYLRYAANGALYDLTKLYAASRLKGRIPDQGLVEALRLDNGLFGLPYSRGNGTITYVRGDWLEKLKMKAPTNYTEFLNMLRAFKNKNPDGIPPDKVIPITAAGLVNTEFPLDIYLREFYQDANPDFVKKGGVWVDGMSDPSMVKALQRMRDAYAEGLIDKEIITNKTSTCRDKFYTGNVGVFNYWAGTWNENLQKNIAPNVANAKVTPIPAIQGVRYVERPAVPVAMTNKGPNTAKNPEGVFEWFYERLWDAAEGQTLMTFGVQGKFYEIKDGKIDFLPSIQNPSTPFTKAWFDPELSVTDFKPKFDIKPLISSSLAMFRKDAVQYALLPASDALVKLLPELNTMKTSFVSKIVYGDMTIEAGLAAYQKDSAQYVKTILADLNKK
jgi:putative aldouronate transport system substrate-binding protein